MTLYSWLVDFLLPIFGDLTQVDGALVTFGNIFWLVLSCVIVHFCVYVPYRLILYVLRYKRWNK